MQTETNPSQFFTIKDASDLLKVKVSTLYAWVYQRKIPFRKHGARVVFEERELREWSEKRRVPEHLDSVNSAWDSNEPYARESSSSLKTKRTAENP